MSLAFLQINGVAEFGVQLSFQILHPWFKLLHSILLLFKLFLFLFRELFDELTSSIIINSYECLTKEQFECTFLSHGFFHLLLCIGQVFDLFLKLFDFILSVVEFHVASAELVDLALVVPLDLCVLFADWDSGGSHLCEARYHFSIKIFKTNCTHNLTFF